jgi:hypothetical protein
MSDAYGIEDEPLLPDDDGELATDDDLDEGISAGAEGGDDGGIDDDRPAPKPPSRAARRIQELDRRVQAAETRASEAERRANEALQRNTSATSIEQERRDAEAYALMSFDERVTHDRRKDQQRIEQLEQRQNILYADLADQNAWNRIVASEPAAARMAKQVDDTLAQERAAGRNPSRENVFNVLYARQMRERAVKVAPKQRAAGRQAVERQQVAQPRGRSDVAASGGRQQANDRAARAARLAKVQFNRGGGLDGTY